MYKVDEIVDKYIPVGGNTECKCLGAEMTMTCLRGHERTCLTM